jgi:hypothetical protein
MLEMLLPEYTRQLLENYQSIFIQLASQLRWLYFDEASRLVTRVGWLDDGYIRLRLEGHWEFTGELLRELSWGLYSVAEVGRNVDMLKNALESVGVDRLRVVGDLTVSEMNVTRVSGVALTGRDWSTDLAKLQNLDIALSALRDAILSKIDELAIPTPTYNQLIDADETVAQSITLDAGGRSLVSVYAKADAATNFYVDVSNDGINWFTALTYAGVTTVNDVIKTGFRYIRLRSDAAGTSGSKVTLVLSAKVG